MAGIHADIEALRGLHEALVRYRLAQREVAERGSGQVRAARASLEEKASRWQARLEQSRAQFGDCQERASVDDTVECAGYARAVEQSAERLEQIRRWQQRIDQEAGEFQAAAGRFLELLETGLPRTEQHLLALIASLEAARRVQVPGS